VSDQKIFEMVTLPWVVRALARREDVPRSP
jgi:hypothetical protein